MTVMINEEVVSRLAAVASPEEDIVALAQTAMMQFIERRERQAAGAAEMQAMLDGPRHLFDSNATYRQYREKYEWSDLSHLSSEELEDHGDALLTALSPEKRAEVERLGLI